MLFQMRYQKDLEEAEERAVTHFRKLIEIKRKPIEVNTQILVIIVYLASIVFVTKKNEE